MLHGQVIILRSHPVPPVLLAMGVMRDGLDDIRKTGERILSILEGYKQKLEPFDDIKLSKQDAVKEILDCLPPDKASLLVAALLDVAKLIPPMSPENMEKQIDKLREDVNHLEKICKDLHTALDEVVQ